MAPDDRTTVQVKQKTRKRMKRMAAAWDITYDELVNKALDSLEDDSLYP